MAYSLFRPAKTADERLEHIMEADRRISYDPIVLRQDGWTTGRADHPDGASGGAYLIGRRVIWSRYEALVIAFVRDEEIGDLWKAMWLEDFETFDLEADELQSAIKKWELREARRKIKHKNGSAKPLLSGGSPARMLANMTSKIITKPAISNRFAATKSFTVAEIEHGIILAASYHPNARHGVMWPARVMHVSEIKALTSSTHTTSRRSSQRNQISIIFIAPYWNGTYNSKASIVANTKNNLAAKSAFSTGSLFEMETLEVSSANIERYPHTENDQILSIDKLRSTFRFLGLPKTAFARYVDSHRLARALKLFAKRQAKKSSGCPRSDGCNADALSALTDTHSLALKTALLPQPLLNLPYEYMLANLPALAEQGAQLNWQDDEVKEPVLQLHLVLQSMTPPHCWGKYANEQNKNGQADSMQKYPLSTPQSEKGLTPVKSPAVRSCHSNETPSGKLTWVVAHFASQYIIDIIESEASSLGMQLSHLVDRLNSFLLSSIGKTMEEQRILLNNFSSYVLMIKGQGEDVFYSKDLATHLNSRNLVMQWQKSCEKIYKCAVSETARPGFGNKVTAVLTDSRCNQHITANGSYERAVRLPAALKGAKMAGAGTNIGIRLITTVNESYMDLAEKTVIPKAHHSSYLKRMKAKIAALPPDARGVPLTDDSDGEGGEDTMGSRGSYKAALSGVATALQAVDMVVGGELVNAFCAIRPPGHHAGWNLRAMNAISNGFCILNSAACAAMYAVTPRSEGGCGLKRVCVIDFDVHHGNGTQEILCSTHDSRFLYVSTHAGGAHINGFEDEQDLTYTNDKGLRKLGGSRTQEGIFPGRCGDISPHQGVLNIPLGQKVTPAAIGNAFVTLVGPAVENFSPELIILSAGFDAHRNDPLGMGALTSEDFGSVTEVACQIAAKTCSGRVISLLEGGYGVPCCRPTTDLFLPENERKGKTTVGPAQDSFQCLDLGEDMPEDMRDDIPLVLQQKLDRCHQEGFLHCVKEHVAALARSNTRGGYGKK